ncbi:MAG: nitroreductase/quinone reductase family protein [Pseudolysinimonas sp.]
MTASSFAAVTASRLEPGLLALLLVVGGGLVEGLALGLLQASVMAAWAPGLSRARWAIVTVLVAGLGWAAASAPSALSATSASGSGSASGGDGPPLLIIIAGALALGAVMGAVLGLGQALVLRKLLPHPWRWIGVSSIGWAPAMLVIFVGATAPDGSWPLWVVVILGAATGLVAGAVLGAVTGALFPLLDGSTLANEVVMFVLKSPAHRLLDRSLAVLRVRGILSGKVLEFPVQCAQAGDDVVVVPGNPSRKTWWHNLRHPAYVELLLRGEWRQASATVLGDGDQRRDGARSTYLARWPKAVVAVENPLVLVQLNRRHR